MIDREPARAWPRGGRVAPTVVALRLRTVAFTLGSRPLAACWIAGRSRPQQAEFGLLLDITRALDHSSTRFSSHANVGIGEPVCESSPTSR
jgi:hypothetical protein